MKKLLFVFAAFLSIQLNAQQLNSNDLYVNADNELYTGNITAVNNGIKSVMQIKQGVVDGEVTYYYASGKIMESGMFTKGQKDQKWTRYNESGIPSAIAFYSLGKKSGTWLVFDDKGNKRFEMNYVDGEKTGTWTNWDEHGTVVQTKDYSIRN
jgi:antitoxin component YwqK of YwqJK toxin-antitoxin module